MTQKANTKLYEFNVKQGVHMLCALRDYAALINLRGVLTKRNHHPPPPATRPRPDAVRIRTLIHTNTHKFILCDFIQSPGACRNFRINAIY